MEVRKVKYLSERVTVERVRANGKSDETLLLEGCADTPHEGFLTALAAVRADVLKRAGLGAQFTKATQVTGVGVSRDGHGHRQFKVSGTVQLKYGPAFGISFPILREKVESEEGETVLSNVERKRIDKLLEEAHLYAEGGRFQQEMDLDGTDG